VKSSSAIEKATAKLNGKMNGYNQKKTNEHTVLTAIFQVKLG